MSFLTFEPIYQTRPWGGRKLQTYLHRNISEAFLGESWDIVDRSEACSIVAKGPYAGKTLKQLRSEQVYWLMGPNWPCERPFPILIKWLDCKERLSLQVHPPQPIAAKFNAQPKTEFWYIAQADPHAALLAGFKHSISCIEFENALNNDYLESLLHKIPVTTGDALFVPSGRIHAIDAGNLVLEIEQNSDTTYRIHDWGRLGLDGKPRTAHVKQALMSVDFEDVCPNIISQNRENSILIECEFFKINCLHLAVGQRVKYTACESMRIISIVAGSLCIDNAIYDFGTNGLIPWKESCEIIATKPSVVLVTQPINNL